MKNFVGLAAVTAALSLSVPAQSASMVNLDKSVILDANDPFTWTFDYDGFTSSAQTPVAGLTSSILFKFLNRTGNNYNFSYTLTNTSGAQFQASRVTIFGFNTNPNSSASVGSGDMFNVISSGPQPNGQAALEICFKDSGPTNNCAGASGGVAIGASTSGTFTLKFGSVLDKIIMSNFTVRYQGINSTTYGMSGASASGVPVGVTTAVPEPATWAMMIGGFGLLGAVVRRRRRTGAAAA